MLILARGKWRILSIQEQEGLRDDGELASGEVLTMGIDASREPVDGARLPTPDLPTRQQAEAPPVRTEMRLPVFVWQRRCGDSGGCVDT